jgi:hypothetical protein
MIVRACMPVRMAGVPQQKAARPLYQEAGDDGGLVTAGVPECAFENLAPFGFAHAFEQMEIKYYIAYVEYAASRTVDSAPV